MNPAIILASMGGQILLSALGEAMAQGDDAKARQIRQQIADKYGAQVVPHFDTAVAEQAQNLAPADDSLRRSQMNALAQLEREYQMGGMTEADRAAMDLAANRAAAKTASDTATIQQGLAQRGMGGGLAGAYLTMQGTQQGSNMLGDMALQSQVDARRRALQALESGANLAGNISQADLARAQAQSGIDRFNASMRWDAQQANRQNQQTTWQNQQNLLGAQSGAQSDVAKDYEDKANDTRRAWGSAAQGVGDAGQVYASTRRKP